MPQVLLEQVDSRLYLVNLPFELKDRAKSVLGMTGNNFDRDRKQWWVGLAKRTAAAQFVAELGNSANTPVEPAKPDPDQIRLTGKGRYKGREYFAGAVTRDGQRVRLLTLPDAAGKFLDFWAPCSEVEQTKKYEPRKQTYRGRTTTNYTTLGSIADFIKRQRNPDTARVQCHECDSWHDANESCRECGGC